MCLSSTLVFIVLRMPSRTLDHTVHDPKNTTVRISGIRVFLSKTDVFAHVKHSLGSYICTSLVPWCLSLAVYLLSPSPFYIRVSLSGRCGLGLQFYHIVSVRASEDIRT